MPIEILRSKLKGSHGISKSEFAVFMMLIEGLSNKEICEKLFVCEKTVKHHLGNVYKKLNVKGRTQAVIWYYSNCK